MTAFDPHLVADALAVLLPRLPTTLLIVLLSAALGSLLGAVSCYARVYRLPVLAPLARAHLSLARGVPLIVQLFLAYFALPELLGALGVDARHWDPLAFVVLAFAFHEAAFFSEIFRAGLLAVDRRQTEAALAIGMTRWQAVSRILAPQAWRIALPGWSSAVLTLIRDTSLAFTIGTVDVMGLARALAARTARPIETYLAAALIFVVLGLAVEAAFGLWIARARRLREQEAGLGI